MCAFDSTDKAATWSDSRSAARSSSYVMKQRGLVELASDALAGGADGLCAMWLLSAGNIEWAAVSEPVVAEREAADGEGMEVTVGGRFSFAFVVLGIDLAAFVFGGFGATMVFVVFAA